MTMHKSGWSYHTSAAMGLSIASVTTSGGMFVLKDPNLQPFEFHFAGAGPGVGYGGRFPRPFRLPDIKLPKFLTKDGTLAGGGATTDFTGRGLIYRLREKELVAEDFAGVTLYLDASIGFLVAGGASIFLTDLKPDLLTAWIFRPELFTNVLLSTATAIFIMAGVSEGLIDGAGIGAMVGHISYIGPYVEP